MSIYLFFGFLFFVTSLLTGTILSTLIFKPDVENKTNFVLFRVLLGVLFICSTYAIIETQFNSVFLLFFCALIFLFKRQNFSLSIDKAVYKEIGIFCLYLVLTFGWQLYYQYKNAFIFHHDQIFYSMVSNMLSTNGVETVYTHPILNIGFHGNIYLF